jgi:hypothetical protein
MQKAFLQTVGLIYTKCNLRIITFTKLFKVALPKSYRFS